MVKVKMLAGKTVRGVENTVQCLNAQ